MLLFFVPTAPSMMSLRQRHIDPQLAIGSQRLVDSCLLSGQQAEGTPHLPRSSAARQSRSQSFGQLDCLPLSPLSSAESQPSVASHSSHSSHKPQSLSSLSSSFSCLPSSVGGTLVSYPSHMHHTSFQPLDPIPDFTFSDDSQVHSSRRNSSGYSFSFHLYYVPLTPHVCGVCFVLFCFNSISFGLNASKCFLLFIWISSSCR